MANTNFKDAKHEIDFSEILNNNIIIYLQENIVDKNLVKKIRKFESYTHLNSPNLCKCNLHNTYEIILFSLINLINIYLSLF